MIHGPFIYSLRMIFFVNYIKIFCNVVWAYYTYHRSLLHLLALQPTILLFMDYSPETFTN